MVFKTFRPFFPTIEKTASFYAPYNFEKLDENATNAICSLKIEYTQDGETVKVSMGFYTQGKKKVQFSAFKDEKAGKIAIDPSSITKVSIGMGKNKKVDINNIVLVAKK